jgi:hypothetical protein
MTLSKASMRPGKMELKMPGIGKFLGESVRSILDRLN